MSGATWEFWKVIGEGGELAWLAITRPGARSAIDRDKVWTLVPRSRVFIANGYVTDEFRGSQGGLYSFENIDVEEARDLIAELSDPSQDDIARLTRPSECSLLSKLIASRPSRCWGGKPMKRLDVADTANIQLYACSVTQAPVVLAG